LNEIFLRIGVFSYLMTGAITIFFEPDWPRRFLRSFGYAAGRLVELPAPKRRDGLILAALHVYVVFQLLMPLRHFLYPGTVSWTEEGHRFAWHMKLRKKDSRITIRAEDPATGRRWIIDPKDDLFPRQIRKLETFPDIVLQYVHHHRDLLIASGVANPIITVDWECSLNGGPYKRLVDPHVNLATVERTWRPAPWILRDGDEK
jgi:hypothetical protein